MNRIDIDRALAAIVDQAATRVFREVRCGLAALWALAALFWIALIIEIWKLLN